MSRVGYGAMQLERLEDRRRDALALLRRAFDLGVNHIDTAEFYGFGFANDVIREAVSFRDDVVIATKIGADPDPGGQLPLKPAQRPEELRASVEANLRSLGVDQLAVVNLRRLDIGPGMLAEGDQVVHLDDQLEVMIDLRREGKIGAIGLSNVTIEAVRHALPAGIACVQNAYSLVGRDHEETLRLCLAEGIAWVPFFPLGGAFPQFPKVVDEPAVRSLADKLGVSPAQVGLAWLLRHADNVLLIPGTADPEHLQANVAAADLVWDDADNAVLEAVESRTTDIRFGAA